MKLSWQIGLLVIFAAWPAFAQVGARTNQVYGANPIPVQTTTNRSGVAAASTNQTQAPATNAVSSEEKPAVVITAQGTVLNDEQRRLISQKLQEIPGVVVITNRIRVLGEISEAAGAARTNRPANRPPTRTYHRPSSEPKSF